MSFGISNVGWRPYRLSSLIIIGRELATLKLGLARVRRDKSGRCLYIFLWKQEKYSKFRDMRFGTSRNHFGTEEGTVLYSVHNIKRWLV
jgi:hypothetical protein